VDVFYRERMLLPPTAELKVTFEGGAKMNVAAEKIAEVTVPIQGAPPNDPVQVLVGRVAGAQAAAAQAKTMSRVTDEKLALMLKK